MTTTTPDDFNGFGKGHLPGLVGVEIITVTRETVESRMAVRREVMAPNGFLHAASVIALADTSCGYGCLATLPQGARGFTTVELKANILGTARGDLHRRAGLGRQALAVELPVVPRRCTSAGPRRSGTP